ncbi:hypothetical protein P3T76_005964 [Phytophthora citrophthora]|uniref:Uncharacterized protein n=1 Tax=Phytophthora citrophthora TaxID=4793 RepID=A0AAD9GEN0_9STRA|nr:hypothetical protein P3T76_009832 [Phytophthora citrophthora]KAK1938864.1 hypothetical protein P3T76_008939 [Phytophthora citrophthora]KAK1942465.1 hypothetical protein P3T76_005964 [Phytophthora citrophthora]
MTNRWTPLQDKLLLDKGLQDKVLLDKGLQDKVLLDTGLVDKQCNLNDNNMEVQDKPHSPSNH